MRNTARWRIEISSFLFDIIYPRKENAVANALSRVCGSVKGVDDLLELHKELCHPGITRMLYTVCSWNLPFFIKDVKRITNNCLMWPVINLRIYNIHPHWGIAFISGQLKQFLIERNVAVSWTTLYNPQGNILCECYNGIIEKTVTQSEDLLSEALGSWEII